MSELPVIRQIREAFCRFTRGHDFQPGSMTKTGGSGALRMTSTFEFSECTHCGKVVF